MDRRCVYSPYLGKNDHPADLLNPEIMEAEEIPPENRQLDCLLPKGKVTFAYLDEDDDEDEDFYKYEDCRMHWTLTQIFMSQSRLSIRTNM